MDGFWLGVACSFPLYFLLDHILIPWIVDRSTRLTVRIRDRE